MAKNVSRENGQPMGLEAHDETTPAAGPAVAGNPTEPPAAAVDRDGRPYCARHNCAMVATGGKGVATYYRCQVAACGETAKRLRGVVPKTPLLCPQRICCAEATAPALEVVPERSTFAQLVMKCPGCGFETTVPRPGVRFPQPRPHDDELAAR